MEIFDPNLLIQLVVDGGIKGFWTRILIDRSKYNLIKYFKGIFGGGKSLLIGMRTSMRVFFS